MFLPRPDPYGGGTRMQPGQARREEVILAALLRSWPQQAQDVVRILQPEAFTDPARREVFPLLQAMLQAGRPAD